ncbi:MAG: MscL family protein, partial [Actinobacteria bacterium]|nr:MscL family protein [Actinomycetota bacterium]
FRKFLMRGNLIDLAVAVVVGVAFNNVVQALIRDLITPLIGALTGSPGGKPTAAPAASPATPTDFAKYYFTLHGSRFMWGDLLNNVISFVVISAVVYYLLIAPTEKLMALAARNQAATDRECPECLSQIPIAAKRCKFCTSEVPPVPELSPAAANPILRRSRRRSLAPE